MSRKEFTELEEKKLAEKKFVILEDSSRKQYASRIITAIDAEFYLIKNDRGFYLKTEPLIGVLDEDDEVNKSFGSFNEVLNFFK